jgi:hypothetical protein
MAVNAGRASEKGRETMERSGGMKRLPGTRSLLRKTREDWMLMESSANIAGLRGESATLPTIGEIPE